MGGIGKKLRRATRAIATMGASEIPGVRRSAWGQALIGHQTGGILNAVRGYRDTSNGIEQARQQQLQANSLNGGTVNKALPGGMANFYDDSWKQILGSAQGGQDVGDTLTNLLQNFQGRPGDLEDFLQRAGPFIAAGQAKSLQNNAGYKHIQDQANWDEGAMGAYGPAAGQIARQAGQANRAGAARMASNGLGRSAAMASMAQMNRQSAAGQQAGLFSQLQQQSAQNRMRNAGNVFDAHRMVAQMALGQTPTPRMQDSGGGGGGLTSFLGNFGAGAAAGGAIGGPFGAAIGGLAFGGAGAAQKK